MCGCEWYQPTTFSGRPVSLFRVSAAWNASKISTLDVSTLSFFTSDLLKKWTWEITISADLASFWNKFTFNHLLMAYH